jgi:hypothetical protein
MPTHLPIVPLAALHNLAGDVFSGQIAELMARKDFSELVLFSDAAGERLALVTVGPGKRFEKLADVAAVELDGLRALCATRAAGGEASALTAAKEKELAQLEESLKARERYIDECEHRLADAGQALSEREALLEQREQQLLAKERDFFRRGGEAAGR